ncbi:hypothetical protein N7509_007591 [Penicillium cosmopolitanum]|uniref:DUF899 domain-containing protein n=1 Tax=Penicillium cosmopolitanum TaxID=1131564 RepID=A0A9W9VZD7_9EURO|nr:uncharacterized protein N7509_007591 [Penicillium cosmopolitanum]KAJ5392101.1 hypothetical protein N7509_007591 [Penicillium cosmopolitanum]
MDKDQPKKIVTAEEFKEARKHLLNQEKASTHLLQKLAESRRNLPMVQIPNPSRFKFDTPSGEKTLLDLFENRKQLIIYHFMLAPHEKAGRDTSFAAVATATIEEVTAFGERMGWEFPFYSSAKTHRAWEEAERDGEVITWKPGNGYFGLSSFLREGDEVFHTYETSSRGLEIISFDLSSS